MRENTKDYEHPEQVWKDVYHNQLVDLEEDRLQQNFPIALVIERIPKYSRFSSLIFLIIGALVCFIAAYMIPSNKSECGFWSSAFLNLGMGLISGCVLWYFTEHRSRIISGYEAVVKTMRKRYETLQLVLNDYLANPHFVLCNMKNFELACEWLRVHHNFILTMLSHFRYWNAILKGKMKPDFVNLTKVVDKKISQIGLGLELSAAKKTKEELRCLCGDVVRLEMDILKSYENRIETLEANVLDLRFGGRSLSRWDKLRRKCKGGEINDQIEFDIALERTK